MLLNESDDVPTGEIERIGEAAYSAMVRCPVAPVIRAYGAASANEVL
jgi:hypothetical protein